MNEPGSQNDADATGRQHPAPQYPGPQQLPAPQYPGPQGYPAPQYGAAPLYGGPQPGGAPAGAPRPRRTGLLVVLIGSGALLLVLVVGGVLWFVLQANAHTPQASVRPFMDALVKGDVSLAVSRGGIHTTSPLVTQKAYDSVKGHVSSYSVRGVSTGSRTATVEVGFRQGGEPHSQTLELTRTGTDMLFFPHWTLRPIRLPSVRLDLRAPHDAVVTVGGVTVDAGDALTPLEALPGDYPVSLRGTAQFSAAQETARITGISSSGQPAPATVELTAALTDAGKKAATDAVNAWVASCIAQQSYQPTGCSFGLINSYPDLQLSNQRWNLLAPPEFTIGDWDGTGWRVQTTRPGSASYSADAASSDGRRGTFYSPSPVNVAVSGEITGFAKDGTATFTSIDWSGKASLPSA